MATVTMEKKTPTSYELHPLIAERWSPRAFADKAVETRKICTLLEAARWAPSCFNEQPWRFFVGSKDINPEALEKLQSLLMDGNAWAKQAPVLMLSVAKKRFAYNNSINRHAQHDVGLAVENLVLQAWASGLVCHQMAGFHFEKAYSLLSIPEDYEPMAMIAIGYPGDASSLSGDLKDREKAPRERNPLQEMVFSDSWQSHFPVCFT